MLYTPEFYAHLVYMRRQYEARRDLALGRVKIHDGHNEEYVKIAQLDLNLALRSLLVINNHIWAAEQKLVNGSAAGSTERTVVE